MPCREASLELRAQRLRQQLLELVCRTGRGHIPSSFSCADLLVAIYESQLFKLRAKEAKSPHRDRVFVSKGHAAKAVYPLLADQGFFDERYLATYCQEDSPLRMYADHTTPGVEAVCGSLGHGIGIACGHALACKNDGLKSRSIVILGDGECYEGSVWEAAMFASHHRLDNLLVIIDRNGLCILDETEQALSLEPLAEKWQSFGFRTASIDGHSFNEILPELEAFSRGDHDAPMAIIAQTVKGKGISFMEGRPEWHNRPMNPAQREIAERDLALQPLHGRHAEDSR